MARRIVLMPAFNEGRTIPSVLEDCLVHVDAILVIDDGSLDDTAEKVRTAAASIPQIELLSLPVNRGMSGALLAGFCYAWQWLNRGQISADDWIITMDSDGQHVPEELPRLLAYASEHELDLVLGRRHLRGYPWFKWLGNWGLSAWASLLSGKRYYDVECGFRIFRAALLPDLIRFFTGLRYGCAQEIAIITALRGWKIDNTQRISIAYYRPGTRASDGLTNLWMGLVAWWAVTFGRPHDPGARVEQVLGDAQSSPTTSEGDR